MVWIVAGISALVIMGWLLRSRRQPNPALNVHFDLLLPSKWAADLCQQLLDNEGTPSRVFERSGQWVCRVARELRAHDCEKTRAHLDMIARGRGGDCPEFVVRDGH